MLQVQFRGLLLWKSLLDFVLLLVMKKIYAALILVFAGEMFVVVEMAGIYYCVKVKS